MLEQSNDVPCRWQLTDTLCKRILFCVSFSPQPVPITRRRPNRFHIISNYNWNRNSCQWGNWSPGTILLAPPAWHQTEWAFAEPQPCYDATIHQFHSGRSIKYHLRIERIFQINSIIYYITRHKYKIELKNKCNLCFSWCVCEERKPYAYYTHCLSFSHPTIHASIALTICPPIILTPVSTYVSEWAYRVFLIDFNIILPNPRCPCSYNSKLKWWRHGGGRLFIPSITIRR